MEKFININERQHEFEINTILQGQEVKGNFKAKYPSIADGLTIDLRMSRILEGGNADTLPKETVDLAYMLAFNETLLIEKPEWYKNEYFESKEIVQEVYMQIYRFVDNFRQRNKTIGNSTNSTRQENGTTLES